MIENGGEGSQIAAPIFANIAAAALQMDDVHLQLPTPEPAIPTPTVPENTLVPTPGRLLRRKKDCQHPCQRYQASHLLTFPTGQAKSISLRKVRAAQVTSKDQSVVENLSGPAFIRQSLALILKLATRG